MEIGNSNKINILKNVDSLDVWLNENKFKYYTLNYTPHFKVIDFLSSKMKFIGILWRQIFRVSPVNFRKALGLDSNIIDPQSTIILANAYLELIKLQPDNKSYRNSFNTCIERVKSLNSNKTNFFAVKQNKKMQLNKYKTDVNDIAPILTVWAGNLFMSAYDYLKDERYLRTAKQIKDYFVNEHPKENIGGDVYFYYSPSGDFKIWNASAEISAFLIQYGKTHDDKEAYDLGGKGINLIVNQQNINGSWFYGNSKTTNYIDNFHTAFILRSLNITMKYCNNEKIKNSFMLGLKYYKDNLFRFDKKSQTLVPKHWVKSYIPFNSNIIQKVDIRDCALSTILFSEIVSLDDAYIIDAVKILNWTNNNMKKYNTYYAEKTWLWTNKIPYIDFQAWMLFANIKLLNSLENE